MTINEAIRHCEEVANSKEMESEFETDYVCYFMTDKEREECKECAADHRQLAEWLRELVAYKKIRMCGNCRHYVRGTTHFGECHVTSDIEPCVVCVNQTACDTFFDYKDLEMESKNNDAR